MNRQPKLLAIDLGFGFTKCIDGDSAVIFQSNMRRDLAHPNQSPGTPEDTHRIVLDNIDYVVGDDLLSPTLLEDFARHPDRLIDTYGRHLILTSMAPFSEQECPIHVVLGLPVANTPHWGPRMAECLSGYHKIGIYGADGYCTRKNIHIRKVHVVPHPLGTFTSLIMNENGAHRESEYHDLKIAIVDIGFRTTGIMVMEASRYCNRGSDCIEMGIANGFEMIARKLIQETGQVPDLNRLYQAIRMGFLRVEDQEYNLTNLCQDIFASLSAALADRINFALKDDWDLDRIVLTGGGSSDLAEHVAPLIQGEVVMIEHDQDSRLGNTQGQLHLARHMWGASGFCDSGK